MSARDGNELRAALVGLRHGHSGTLNPAAPGGLCGTFSQVPGVRIVALCEPADPAVLAREHAFAPAARAYNDVDALLADGDFDLAVIALQAVDVPPAATRLLSAGKHCFIEKTVARSAAEFAPVVEAARQTGAHVQVHFPWRYHPAVRKLRELLVSGVLGRPAALAAQMVTSQVGPLPGQRSPASRSHRFESEGGGMLHFLGGHFLEVMCYLFGEVKTVSAVCAPAIGNMEPRPEMDDVASVSLRFANGAVGTFQTGFLCAVQDQVRDFVSVWGTDGAAYWSRAEPQVVASSRVAAWAAAPIQTFGFVLKTRSGAYGGSEWIFDVARGFVEGIAEGTRPEVGAEEALRVLRITDAAYESSQTNRTVAL